MTAKAAIVIADSSLTPESPGTPAAANRTFTPGAVENGFVHTFYEGTTGTSPDTRSKLTISIKPADVKSPVSRVKLQLATPKSHTVDGVVQRAHVNRVFVEFVLDKDATRDDRRDLKGLIYNLLADNGVKEMVDNLEDLY